MLKFLLIIAGIVVIVGAVIALCAFMKPDEFRVSRSVSIAASADQVFEEVNDLHKWQMWSPWAEMDPDAIFTFEGPVSGEGAAIRWEGKKTGKGIMTIVESRTPDFIRFRLDFLKPMKATNTAEFMFTQTDGQTIVKWDMYGKNSFIGKVMMLFMNCEKMVGEQFERGLTKLKAIAESKHV
jgi:hypothetical protein